MKRSLILLGVAAAALALVAAAGAKQQKASATVLNGAGSTFVAPLVSVWTPALGSAFDYTVQYSAVGSGAGISQITARTVDFGASDAPLTPDQFSACNGCVQIPWALAGTAIDYNIPGLVVPKNTNLHLTGDVIAKIYMGQITKWDDPAIKALNPKATIPDLTITCAHRSDNSGTTYNFTDYLSTVSPAWKSKLGRGTNAQWPTGVGGKGSSGVSGVVTKTVGSIGYADVAYSLSNHLRFASVLNASGKYTTPGLRGIAAAAATLPKKLTGNGEISLVNPPKGNPIAYPISTFTYVIVPTNASKAADLRKMIYWAVTQGQKSGPKLLFQPLPKQVQAFDFKQIKLITG